MSFIFIFLIENIFVTQDSPIPFRNELIVDRNASIQIRPSVDALKRETIEIESQIKQLQVIIESVFCLFLFNFFLFHTFNEEITHLFEFIPNNNQHFDNEFGFFSTFRTTQKMKESLESLIRTQIRVLESQLYNKSSELQEDISMKKFDLQTKRLHLAAIRAQVSIIS